MTDRGRQGSGWGLALMASLVLACTAPISAKADGGASDWFVTDQGRVRLVAATPGVGDAAVLSLGLEFHLEPHWKIYWRSPGDAGYPPRLDWAGSTNLADTQMSWPAPKRFSVQGLETVGYTDTVVFPITARLVQPGEAVRLQVALSYLTCSEICLPYDTKLALELPAGMPAGGGGFAGLIARNAARVPGDGSASGLTLSAATIVSRDAPLLELRVGSQRPLANPDAFVEGPAGVAFGAPVLASGDAPGQSVLRLRAYGSRAALERLVGERLTVTVTDGDRSVEAVVTPSAGPPAENFSLLLGILPLALLGGFILNFMPCVLPVLSIKLLSVVEQGGRSRRAVRLGFLASAAGVVLSFLGLAGVMLAFKAGGVAVGWGVQFQQPLFLIAMVALLTLFAGNLWGFFEVPLPQAVSGMLGSGDSASVLGNLAAGAFATLLATPCSAPFLGTAVGFALAAGPVEIVAIFLALGIGLAAPYLLVALMPNLALHLPRPGRWMVGLRRLLGFSLAGTAAWLISVLVTQIGLNAALAVGALMVVATAALALLGIGRPRRAVVAALLLAAFGVPIALGVPPSSGPGDTFWRPFDRDAIAKFVGEGRVVFVDVTADWCLTCKLNEQLVIDAPAIHRRLASADVVAMRADWTRPSDAISAYLRSFGRYGIPFNAVYGPAAPGGLALSEILTSNQVLSALAEAAKPGKVADTSR